jgi:hypothetical protein
MSQPTTRHSQSNAVPMDGHYWTELRQAISSTSGFKRWILEENVPAQVPEDDMVQLYLRRTLETLAY